MLKTITQKITFKNITPESLFEIYLSPEHHSNITNNSEVKISKKIGASFSAYDGFITGKNLQIIKNTLIVQSWIASDWEDAIESTLVLRFLASGNNTILFLTHANVPEEHAASLAKGWHEHYWENLKEYIRE